MNVTANTSTAVALDSITPKQPSVVVPTSPSEARRDSANRWPPATFMGIDEDGFAVYHNVIL